MKKEILIISLFLLFVTGVVIVGESQREENLPKVTIINETYEPKHIHRHPIKKNYTTRMRVEEKVKIFNLLVLPETILVNTLLN